MTRYGTGGARWNKTANLEPRSRTTLSGLHSGIDSLGSKLTACEAPTGIAWCLLRLPNLSVLQLTTPFAFPACCKRRPGTGVLRAGAWRRSGNGSSLHGSCRGRARTARHRHFALSVSLHGAGARRPDPPKVAQAAVRAAVAAAKACTGTSAHCRRQIVRRPHDVAGAGESPLQASWTCIPGISATSGRPPFEKRAEHLFEVQMPMLFLQGTRDTLASLDQLKPLCKKLGRRATLKLFADADHSFHVPARTGRKDAQVLGDVLDAFAAWLDSVIAPPGKKS